jgi:hypothetical protein
MRAGILYFKPKLNIELVHDPTSELRNDGACGNFGILDFHLVTDMSPSILLFGDRTL